MAKQVPHIVADCPNCNCPIEIQPYRMRYDTICRICGEPFSVSKNDNVRLTVAASESWHLPLSAGHATAQADDAIVIGQGIEPQWHLDDVGRTWVCPPCSDKELHPSTFVASNDSAPANWVPVVLMVEHRDEVFARIAADVAETGYWVLRAETADEALRFAGNIHLTLVIANSDLPDHSGWLMTAKLRFIDPEARIWLYESNTTQDDEGMAQFLRIDELLDYGGNLLKLSEMVVELMIWHERSEARAALDPVELAIA